MSEKINHQISVITRYLKNQENQFCADCKRPNPTWASMNLGVFICIKCSGCHREIGVHITKIKSINLDLWPPKILNDFGKINNKIANNYWEYNLPKDFDFNRIRENDFRLQEFIRDKYEYKKWVNKELEEPMEKINREGVDLVKDYERFGYKENLNKNENNGNGWEDDNDDIKRYNSYKVKQPKGKSFGILNKNNLNENKNNSSKNVVNNNINNNVNLIDFDNNNNNNNNNSNNNNNHAFSFINKNKKVTNSPQPSTQKGFDFIKKNKTPQPTSFSNNNFINFNNNTNNLDFINNNNNSSSNNNNSSSNNNNLVDLFNVETETSSAIKHLNENLSNAYNNNTNIVEENNNKIYNNIINLNNNMFNNNNNNFNYFQQNNYNNNNKFNINPNNYKLNDNNMNINNNSNNNNNIYIYNNSNKQVDFKSDYVNNNINSIMNNNKNKKDDKDPFKNLVTFK